MYRLAMLQLRQTHLFALRVFYCGFFRVFFCKILSSVKRSGLSFLSIWTSFLSLSGSVVLGHFHTVLDGGGERGRLCLVPDLRRKVFGWCVCYIIDFWMLNQPCILGISPTRLWYITYVAGSGLLVFCHRFCWLLWVSHCLQGPPSSETTYHAGGRRRSRNPSTVRTCLGGFYCVFISAQGITSTQRILIVFSVAAWEIRIFFPDCRWVRRCKTLCVHCINPSALNIFIVNVCNGS